MHKFISYKMCGGSWYLLYCKLQSFCGFTNPGSTEVLSNCNVGSVLSMLLNAKVIFNFFRRKCNLFFFSKVGEAVVTLNCSTRNVKH